MTDIKKINLALIIGMLTAMIFSFMSSSADEVRGITKSVVRLHILANSDSVEDQNLKLYVRDKILEGVGSQLESESQLGAEIAIIENLDEIKNIAEKAIQEQGYDYTIQCELVHMDFEEKAYDAITMPAGDYDALRIYIGEAKGQNWWCVLFPKLCLGSFSEISGTIELEDVFSDEEILILEQPQKVEYKFKCFEVFRKIGSFFGL